MRKLVRVSPSRVVMDVPAWVKGKFCRYGILRDGKYVRRAGDGTYVLVHSRAVPKAARERLRNILRWTLAHEVIWERPVTAQDILTQMELGSL